MRYLTLFSAGASLGHLITQGLIDNDTDKWLFASIAFISVIGYMWFSHKRFFSQPKNLK